MNILVLQGSPKADGNTAFLANAFKEGAESAGHKVNVLHVGGMNIAGCRGCEYCHKTQKGCCQQDDMVKVYDAIKEADMVVVASSVYYWGLTAQIQACITRLYCLGRPDIEKYAMILSSGSPDVYDGIIYSYKSTLGFFKAEDCGIKYVYGDNNKSVEAAEELKAFGAAM